jgi:hypothetical protein
MQQILRTERRGDGVDVVWEEEGTEMTSYFTFTELIGMRVNALDILENPRNYGIDEKARRISYIAYCQPSWHQE